MSIALSNRNSLVLLGLAAGAGTFFWLRNWLGSREVPEAPAAAFAGSGAPQGSFVHTRDAGPDHMRDEEGEHWDQVDQTSDESFPASDPPGSY